MNIECQPSGMYPIRDAKTTSCCNQMTFPANSACCGSNDERLIGGGFAFPFLLGGVTGAALAPAFWRPGYGYNRPYYYPYPPMPPRWF